MSEILRMREVERRTGLSRATIYRQMEAGKFPRQLQLTEKSVGWSEADISDWVASRKTVSP